MIALLRRDLRLAVRAGGGFGLALAFFLIVVTFVPFGVGPDRAVLARIAPGVLWVGALLSALLSLDRLFQTDWEDGTLELLAVAPIPLEGTAAVKALAHWLTTGLPLAVLAPVLAVLLHLPPAVWPWLVASLLAGTPALSFIGSFGAALTVGLKRGGLLLSVLVMPLYVPTLIFGARAVSLAAEGRDPWPALMLTLAISLAAAGALPFASARALRMNLC